MKTYTLGISEKAMPRILSWEEKLETAHAAGYDFAEMIIDDTNGSLKQLELSCGETVRLLKLMEKASVPIQTISLPIQKKYPLGSSNEKLCAKGLNILERAVLLASRLGNTVVQLPGYDVYYELSTEETRRRFAKNLRQAAGIASLHGISLGVKPMDTEFMNTVQKAEKYAAQAENDCIGIYPDIGSITNAAKLYGNDVLRDIKAGQGHLLGIQLKESLPGQSEAIPFGMGHVNFSRTIHMAWKMGVRRYAVEMNYRGNTNWRVDMMAAQSRMRGILDKLVRTNS